MTPGCGVPRLTNRRDGPQAYATLKHKGVTLQAQDFIAHALQQRRDGADVDEALGAATEAAIVASAARTDTDQKERA